MNAESGIDLQGNAGDRIVEDLENLAFLGYRTSTVTAVNREFAVLEERLSPENFKSSVEEFFEFVHGIPDSFLPRIASRYAELSLRGRPSVAARKANLWLQGLRTVYGQFGFARCSDDIALDDLAQRCAERAYRALAKDRGDAPRQANSLVSLIHREGLTPSPDIHELTSEELEIRYESASWWRRKLRKEHTQLNEMVARDIGLVNSQDQLYVSDNSVEQFIARQQMLDLLIEHWVLTDLDSGESCLLRDAIQASVANPVNRRHEMVTRINGIELWSQSAGHVAAFVTLTAPGRMHHSHHTPCKPNDNWDGSMPDDVHRYLNKVWSRVRANWKRRGLTCYGLRVVEPHSDGTPHWHLLLFASKDQIELAVDVFRSYALEDSPDEVGAQKARFRVDWINPDKGSATGYVVKYIIKNIDAADLDDDLDGKGVSKALRSRVWASAWGIRQFQFYGEPCITIWRELRRVTATQMDELPELLKQA